MRREIIPLTIALKTVRRQKKNATPTAKKYTFWKKKGGAWRRNRGSTLGLLFFPRATALSTHALLRPNAWRELSSGVTSPPLGEADKNVWRRDRKCAGGQPGKRPARRPGNRGCSVSLIYLSARPTNVPRGGRKCLACAERRSRDMSASPQVHIPSRGIQAYTIQNVGVRAPLGGLKRSSELLRISAVAPRNENRLS